MEDSASMALALINEIKSRPDTDDWERDLPGLQRRSDASERAAALRATLARIVNWIRRSGSPARRAVHAWQ